MNRKILLAVALGVGLSSCAKAQEATIAPTDNLVVDGIAKVPASLAETAGRYASFRSANFVDWNPATREMLIATRFADTPQIHLVKQPGGERQQLTFFTTLSRTPDFIRTAETILCSQRISAEASGISFITTTRNRRRDAADGWKSAELDGAVVVGRRSARIHVHATHGQRYGFMGDESADPKSDHLLTKLEGGGWEPLDWSPDDSKILLAEGLSINESYLWLVDTKTGEKTPFIGRSGTEKIPTKAVISAKTEKAFTSRRTRIPNFTGSRM